MSDLERCGPGDLVSPKQHKDLLMVVELRSADVPAATLFCTWTLDSQVFGAWFPEHALRLEQKAER